MKKYTDVDIVAELQKLVDSHVDSYKEDFDIDKRIIRRAAESQNPEDKTLMWFCRPHGTHCLNENQVFIQGTRDHNTFRFYAEQTYDECIARVIVPKAVKRGKVFGDVFEINYREQAANVAQNSVAPDHDRLTFADGFVLDAPCRSSFDAAMALVGEHGGVKTHQTLPKDADALAEVLSKQKTRRDRLPDAERTEALSPLPVADLRKYEAVKKAHPNALVCFAQNGYFELYGKDAQKAAPLLGTKLLEKKVRGKPSMPVTGFRETAWVAGSHKLWKSGADVFLSKDGETFKELKAADYIPVGATLNVDGIKCRIDAVDFAADEVRLTNIEDKNRPIRFSESIQYVRSYVEDDTYGDEAACIIVDERGKLVLDDVYNGFDDDTLRLLDLEVKEVPEMPDPAISVQDMKDYGYAWAGVLPAGQEAAEKALEKGCEVYRLYSDNTEGLCVDAKEIADHAAKGGMLGISKESWMAALEKENYLKAAEMSMEDDYGMIDGIINNGPKEDKTAEVKSPERGEKSSIMDRLKSAKAEKQKECCPPKKHKGEIEL